MRSGQKSFGILLVLVCCVLASCSSRLGYGVLLWSTEDPPIPSGTVLPVYIRSNLNGVWVVGVPDGYKGDGNGIERIEVPLSRLEIAGSRRKASRQAESFAPFALLYAENLQDRLPIREDPDNNARQVYRLRRGEVMKVLSSAEGSPPVSAAGEPLSGEWYRVLTEDGNIGYCFSFRLRIFEYSGGQFVASTPPVIETLNDPDLDMLMTRVWSPESYATMVNNRRINIEELSRRWHFDPGQETGIARIYISGIDRSFEYASITPDGRRAWRFEGTNLSMQLRSDTTLAVQFLEGGATRTLLFVSLQVAVDDLILQENARRERLYSTIYSQGPVFTSNNYGTIMFGQDGTFAWRDFDLLVPEYIGETVGDGMVSMDLFLATDLEDRYSGAFTMRFAGQGGRATVLRCMYALDSQGFRIEIVPETSIEGVTVTRRATSPMVLYFFRDVDLW